MATNRNNVTAQVEEPAPVVAYGYVDDNHHSGIEYFHRINERIDVITDNDILKAEMKMEGWNRLKQIDLIFGIVDVDLKATRMPRRYYCFSHEIVTEIQDAVKNRCFRPTDTTWVEAERVFRHFRFDKKNYGLGQFIFALVGIGVKCWLTPKDNIVMVKLGLKQN